MTDQLVDVLAAVLLVSTSDLPDDASRRSLGTWTSLRHLQIVAAVEDAFMVSLTPREIRSISSVGDVRRLLDERGAIR